MKNLFEVRGETTVIFIEHKGEVHECLIDTVDLPKVNIKGTWFLKNHGYIMTQVRRNGGRDSVLMHRAIVGEENIPEGMEIDHQNRNKLDNRKNNLRVVTPLENKQNKGQYKRRSKLPAGVYKNGKYFRVLWVVNGEQKYFGSYKTLEEATKKAEKVRGS
jgi:hypothetical protein